MTALEVVDIVWKKLDGSSLKGLITGGIYKGQRPVGSSKEDIVVNILGLPNEQLAQALVNVNLHVPNKPIKINGQQDNSQPDFSRLMNVANVLLALLKEDYSSDGWYFELQQHSGPVIDDNANSHYINIRIDFFSINI